jgi:Holliday junction resolvasome RuvABC endonuclease subunit
MRRTVVVGLDLSLTSTGIARVEFSDEKTRPTISVMTVKSAGKRADTLRERHRRLAKLVDTIVAQALGADLAVIEAPAFSRSNPGMHDRSGLWWLVTDRLLGDGYVGDAEQLAEVAPSARAKYATGKGNAGKDEVIAEVARRFMSVNVRSNDEADALILAAMGCRHLGTPIDDMPALHRTSMDKVAWPEVVTS